MLATIKGKKVEIGKTDFFCGDKNADKIYFCFPLEYETLSLEGVPVYIKTKNALGGHSKASLKSFKVSNELYVEWILGAEATAVCGKLLCQLVFEKDDGSVIFNTDTFYIYIGESISDNAPGVILETNHITQLQNQMQELIKNYKALAEGEYVVSVNGESGTVLITPEKIGALSSGADISLLTNDANYVSLADIQNGIEAHDNSESAHADIRAKILELSSASSDSGNKMRLFGSLSEMITALNLHASTVFKSGDVLKVTLSGIPGFYVRSVESGQSTYTYVSAAATVRDAYSNGYIQVGYYKISVEEGYKQDVLGKSGSVSLSVQNWINNVYYPCWVLSDNKLYCFGGQYKTIVNRVEYRHVSNKIFCYDLESGTSLGQVGTMPYSAHSIAGCAANGIIYGFGGMQTGINETSTVSAQGCTASAFSFDTRTKEVKSICSLPGKGYDGSAIYIGDDKVLIAGCTMSDVNYDATRMLIYRTDTNEYSDSSVKFPTLMLNDNTYYTPAWCGLARAQDSSVIYAAARSNVYKIDIGDVLEKNHIFVDCDKYGKKLKVANGTTAELYMPIKKIYLGSSDNEAVAKTCYSYVKKTVTENNYNCVQQEIESGTTLTASISCGIGDRLIAAVAVRTTSVTLSDGWTILNGDWNSDSNKIESNSSAYAAQYTFFATKAATSSTESLTVTTSSSGRAFVSLINIKKNSNGTPAVSVNNHNIFNNRTNGQHEFAVTRPSGLIIWYANCILYDNFSVWTSRDETQTCITNWASRQAIFMDQNIANAGKTIKFNSAAKSTTAIIGSVTVTGIDDFRHDVVDGDLSGWVNIENGEKYEG